MATFVLPTRTLLAAVLQVLAHFTTCSIAAAPAFFGGAELPDAPKLTSLPKVLKLERQSVILPQTVPRAGKRKNFYSAKLQVGEPGQEFHVSFDLGGGTMVLPAESCTDKACLERRRYDKWISASAEDIQANGHLVQPNVRKTMLRRRDRGTLALNSIDVGSGSVKGTFVRDKVCVGKSVGFEDDDGSEPRCFPLAMLMASTMSDLPFELEPYDGTVGLGLNGMSVNSEFNFLAGFHRAHGASALYPNSFGLHIGNGEDGGEIIFGGYDVKRLTHPLQWAPVADPQEGRWQVAISAIRVGNNTIKACGDRACRAAIDYSASLFGAPPSLASSVEAILAKLSPPGGFGNGCQHASIPDLHLELENDVTLTLPSEDFVSDFGSSSGAALNPSCNPLLTHHHADESLGQDVFILGESTLRRYYTFFNADTLSVGFSLAAGVPSKNLLANGKKNAKKGKEVLDGDNPVVILVQVKLLRSKTVSSLGL